MAENSNILENLEEYVKVGWEARKTPISAANLNKMDEAIKNNRDAILSLKEKTNENIVSISEILNQLDVLEKGLEDLQNQIPGSGGGDVPADVVEQLSNLNSKVSSLETDVSILTSTVIGLNNKTNTLENDVVNLNNTVNSFNSKITANEKDIVILKGQVAQVEQDIEDLKNSGGGEGGNSEELKNVIKDVKELQSAVYNIDTDSNELTDLIPVGTRFELPNAPEEGTCYLVLDTQSVYRYENGSYTFIKSRIKVIDGGGAQ